MTDARSAPLPLLLAVTLAACGAASDAAPAPAVATVEAAVPAPVGVVDSILPPGEALRRFREGLPAVDRLEGGARSPDALARRFVRAVEAHDTAALRAMVVSRAEFAHLLYPTSRFARPPMQQDPALVWMQVQLNSEKGIVRLLRRHGGAQAGYRGLVCADAPVVEGENRLWEGCAVRVAAPEGGEVAVRWFGSIVERGGRFKLVSYANGL